MKGAGMADSASGKRRGAVPLKLTRDDKMLILLREELYGGSWKRMEEDLQGRLDARLHVFRFRLARRIEADLERIRRLALQEKALGVNFADLVRAKEKA